jgi:type IV pilus assembly protein PilO
MNLVEELQSLDANDVGRWPLPFRIGVIVIVFILVAGLGIYFTIVKDKAPLLERAQNEEQELRLAFENKQRKAANYDAYKAQLTQIEQSFGTMLRRPAWRPACRKSCLFRWRKSPRTSTPKSRSRFA